MTNESIKTTKEVANEIGCNVQTLFGAVWRGAIREPQRMGKALAWTDADIKAARDYFNRRK